MNETQSAKIIRLAKKLGVLRPRDLEVYGLPRMALSRLEKKGILHREGWGLYTLAGHAPTEHQSLIQAAKRIPHGVICLLSALQFHGVGTQLPHEVWMAMGEKEWRPKLKTPPLRIFRFSGAALTEGVEEHKIEGVPVKVYGVAKTVADCFKYRNKIGLEVGLEALKECRRERRCSLDDLWRYAKICRVANLMQPYLEATA